MDQTEIRPATASDVSAIENVVEDAYAHYINRLGRKPAPMTDDYIKHIEAGEVWVLTTGEGVASLIVLRTESDHLLVVNVAVGKAYQGHGFGKGLLNHAEAYARQKELDELRLYTNRLMHENLAIYPKLGWEEYKRADQDGFRRVFMRKILPQATA